MADHIRPRFHSDAPAPAACAAIYHTIRKELGLVSENENNEAQEMATNIIHEDQDSSTAIRKHQAVSNAELSGDDHGSEECMTVGSESVQESNFNVNLWSRTHYIP